MTDYTQEEWWACCDGNESHSHFVFAGPEKAICKMLQNDPRDLYCDYESLEGNVTHEERQANARLISAAPNLYEAAKKAVELIQDEEVKKLISDAILKAEKGKMYKVE